MQLGPWDSKAMRPGWKGGWNTLTEYLATDSKASKNPDKPTLQPPNPNPIPEHLPGVPL